MFLYITDDLESVAQARREADMYERKLIDGLFEQIPQAEYLMPVLSTCRLAI